MEKLTSFLSEPALEIFRLSKERWGRHQAIIMAGHSDSFVACLEKLFKFASFNEPLMITGDSGSGKECFGKACHLLSDRWNEPFVAVNCPQYQDGALTGSELFGHAKGSFTGASVDRKGDLECATGGTIFFDEVADLSPSAQKMLLRALAEQEFKPVGASKTVKVNVRMVSATNRPLKDLILANEFREDLYFRLRFFPLDLPPLRERDNDGLLLVNFFLDILAERHGVKKRLSGHAEDLLKVHSWPGNAREAKSIATMGYCMSNGDLIFPSDFEDSLEIQSPTMADAARPKSSALFDKITVETKSFWEVIYEPFMARDLCRNDVIAVISKGLIQTRGSYRDLIRLFNLGDSDYQKFMDFLRHHRLKPITKFIDEI